MQVSLAQFPSYTLKHDVAHLPHIAGIMHANEKRLACDPKYMEQ